MGILICKRPDKDVPKLLCGYPLPCPHHTVIIDLTKKKREKREEQIINLIYRHILLIEKEIKPVSLAMVENKYAKSCVEEVKAQDLFTVVNTRGETHTAIYVFKYPCMEDVINFTLGRTCDPKVVRRWIEGKMFGYPDEKISKFIEGE